MRQLADKTIYLFPPTLDKPTNDYIAAFKFRGRGGFIRHKQIWSMPDFYAWVRASMPKPYPLKVNEEHMETVTRLTYDCGLTIAAVPGGVRMTMDDAPGAEE